MTGQRARGRVASGAFSEELSAHFDGELEPSASEAVQDRLASDPDAASARERIRDVSRFLRTPTDPDPGFVVRFRARREALSVFPRWTWRQLGLRLAGAAAVLLAAAAVSLLTAPDAGAPEGSVPASAELPAPAESLLALEDEILGADPGEGDVNPATSGDGTLEPVLRIALGSSLGGFDPGR